MIPFFLIALFIYVAMHYYVFRRITRDLCLPGRHRRLLAWLLVLLGLLFLAGHSRVLSGLRVIPYFGGFWLGCLAMACTVFALKDLIQALTGRQARTLTRTALGVLFSLVMVAYFNGNRLPRARFIDLPIPSLSASLDGLRLVHLSDLHLGRTNGVQQLTRVVERTCRLHPDLVLITGDLVDKDISNSPEFVRQLQRLRGVYGTYAVPGNHDNYADIAGFHRLCRRAGIQVLSNQGVYAAPGLYVAGVEDPATRGGSPGPDTDKALAGGEDAALTILLNHRPVGFYQAVRKGVDLQLSGHTHGGQIPPMDLIVYLYYPHSHGLYRRGSAFLYTSCGTLTWGPPMRLFTLNEIVCIRLTCGKTP